ncbi:M28 family peptidase [Shewanella youngdeokensis]|uniref:M28 family peptidase n=1 Tax=Shewanella youngdeokensis TaxID=2999068 RepID=A0ABZ0K141_9GAMM|nr:M28 family peptidase [Shewanella sp. DAU334]
MRIILVILISASLVACSSPPYCAKKPHSNWVNLPQLSADIHKLASDEFSGRKTNSAGAALTRSYLINRFQQIGIAPWLGTFQHEFQYSVSFANNKGVNIAGVVLAPQPTQQWRIITAHYDHLGSKGSRIFHGADDNASGVAALLQIAQQAVAQPRLVNILFVATDAEEAGLHGAYALVGKFKSNHTEPQIEQIELAINLDMIGRPTTRKAIYIEGTRHFESYEQLQQSMTAINQLCIRTRQPRSFDGSVISSPVLQASDHYPMHKAGIPWLYFGVPAHRDYHKPSDTAEKIEINFVAAVAESAYQLLIINSLLLKNTL